MQKRYSSISVFVAILAVVVVIGYLIPQTKPPLPERILLNNSAGKVVFNHQKHATNYNVPCQTCHHESTTQRDNVTACGTCHGVEFTEEFSKTHAENIKDKESCVTCHHLELETGAKWSHADHAEEYGLECTSCHHEDTDIEPEPQSCANCHDKLGDEDMPSLRNAVHAKCQDCHTEMFEAKVNGCENCHTKIETRKELTSKGIENFELNQDFVKCAVCHIDQNIQEIVPNRMTAFHGQCITCHEKEGKGPYTKEQCNQCHTK